MQVISGVVLAFLEAILFGVVYYPVDHNFIQAGYVYVQTL